MRWFKGEHRQFNIEISSHVYHGAQWILLNDRMNKSLLVVFVLSLDKVILFHHIHGINQQAIWNIQISLFYPLSLILYIRDKTWGYSIFKNHWSHSNVIIGNYWSILCSQQFILYLQIKWTIGKSYCKDLYKRYRNLGIISIEIRADNLLPDNPIKVIDAFLEIVCNIWHTWLPTVFTNLGT